MLSSDTIAGRRNKTKNEGKVSLDVGILFHFKSNALPACDAKIAL